MTPIVRLQDVQVVAAGRVLLQVPHLAIGAGERIAVVGPNGAGKSTLLRLIGGLVPAAQGQVDVLGRSIGPAAPGRPDRRARRMLRRDIGLLMQGLHLVPRLTARENVLIGALARLEGVDAWRSWLRWYPPALVAEADAALSALDLGSRADVRADRLSGGERQKVALARLRLQRPRLVLADEPTSALDPTATRTVCERLRATVDAPGHALVTVVHDPQLLPVLATRVLGIAQGRVQWDLPLPRVTPTLLQALYAAPADAVPAVHPEAGADAPHLAHA
jgi:phosphonate transport system ATP-binding protein